MRTLLTIGVMLLVALGLAAAQGGRAGQPTTPAQPAQGGQQRPPQLPPGTASLSGTVVVMGSGQTIPAANIELRRADCNTFSNPAEVVTTTTDGNGKFEFQNLRA